MLFLIPQYVQYVQDGSAFVSGLEVAPFGVALGLVALVSGRLVARFGSAAVILAGLLTAAAGFVPLLFLSAGGSAALVLVGTALFGCGLGAMAPPVTAVIMNDVGTAKAGDGAAVNQVARQVGGALGVAIVGSVFAAVYSAEISADRVPGVAGESIQDATESADRLHGAARADLLTDAVASFDVAARWGLAVCMAVVLLGAVSAAVGLSRTPPAE
jgi:Na+/melibiose symporter-like transporter